MSELRFAVFGAGFWAKYQLAAWQEIEGARCVAIFNRTRAKAMSLAKQFKISQIYDDVEELFRNETVDFVDIITDVCTHQQLVLMAAEYGVPAICQKPLADSLASAKVMVDACRKASTPLLVHENWRWQNTIRGLKEVLDRQQIGRVFRARIQYCNSFPLFENQPFLKTLDKFILSDVGIHLLDTVRFLFGEAERIYCHKQRIHNDINGEDVATLMLEMCSGSTITCEISYASKLENERFPQTFFLIEASEGFVELSYDYWLRITTENGTLGRRLAPTSYPWADPAYDLVHASIVPCHQNLFDSLRGQATAETTGEDNLRSIELVEAAYESAGTKKCVWLPDKARGGNGF